jgi:hypothetical protein
LYPLPLLFKAFVTTFETLLELIFFSSHPPKAARKGVCQVVENTLPLRPATPTTPSTTGQMHRRMTTKRGELSFFNFRDFERKIDRECEEDARFR